MRIEDEGISSNIEDRRGMGGVGLGGGLGLGGIAILVIGYFLGIDPSTLLNVAQHTAPPQQAQLREGPVQDEMGQFVGHVLGSTERVWTQVFQDSGSPYRKPHLVLYDGATQSSCGLGRAAMGPFYCPRDERVYLDLSFFRDLQTRFHAPGQFPEAYVIAHEVGHHVQKLTGISDRMEQMQGRVSRAEFNRASVRLELQADCFAGVWANHAADRARITEDDIRQGLAAAAAIGDDRLQRQSQGTVVPESFTHGSSEQRVRWFTRGIQSGNPESCNTFSAGSL